jgi:hypothetical protein
MSRTEIPLPGPVAKGMTPEGILDVVHEQLRIAWADYDKTGDMDSFHYYAGLVDAYHDIQSFITGDAVKKVVSSNPTFTQGFLIGAGLAGSAALMASGFAMLRRQRQHKTTTYDRKANMLTKTIEFPDLDGNKVSETFYFRYTQAELMKKHIVHENEGGFRAFLERVVDSKDGQLIMDTFEQIIAESVGVKHEDNRRFIKNEDVKSRFMESDAYSEFFTEIVFDAEFAGKFFAAIVPAGLSDKAKTLVEEARAKGDTSIIGEEGLKPNTEPTPIPVAPEAEETLKDFEEYSREELLALTEADFFKVVGTENPRLMTKVQQSIAMERRTRANAPK